MKWSDERDRVSIYNSTSESSKRILDLVEEMNDHWELDDHSIFDLPSGAIYTPDDIANALLLLSSHFDKSEEFFESLSWVEKNLVYYQTAFITEIQAQLASEEKHLGEADERISDSAKD